MYSIIKIAIDTLCLLKMKLNNRLFQEIIKFPFQTLVSNPKTTDMFSLVHGIKYNQFLKFMKLFSLIWACQNLVIIGAQLEFKRGHLENGIHMKYVCLINLNDHLNPIKC